MRLCCQGRGQPALEERALEALPGTDPAGQSGARRVGGPGGLSRRPTGGLGERSAGAGRRATEALGALTCSLIHDRCLRSVDGPAMRGRR